MQSEIIQNIAELKRELDTYRPIPNNILNTLNYKLRLEWNYHSNKMEGGTLTFEETRSVMMAQLSVDGKPLRDVLEMHGHDEVVKNIQQMGEGAVRITENRIKEIHKTIIHDQEDTPGRFKNRNNYIYNYQGERFDFVAADDMVEAMNSLSNWLDNQLRLHKKGKNPLTLPEIAFDYHVRFLTIHPFLDGNGRTARILMNLLLIAHNYPPVIVRDDEKDLYNKHIAHAQQYEQNPQPFYDFLGKLLIRSFELSLKAVKGEPIFND
jgi:Fic family protein